ncbi:MAG: hypothetical protein K0S79_67 [Nitrospira sp.]|jgi:hypothetical protein|nr:hypothetical protein [Nitrospira sp.]
MSMDLEATAREIKVEHIGETGFIDWDETLKNIVKALAAVREADARLLKACEQERDAMQSHMNGAFQQVKELTADLAAARAEVAGLEVLSHEWKVNAELVEQQNQRLRAEVEGLLKHLPLEPIPETGHVCSPPMTDCDGVCADAGWARQRNQAIMDAQLLLNCYRRSPLSSPPTDINRHLP